MCMSVCVCASVYECVHVCMCVYECVHVYECYVCTSARAPSAARCACHCELRRGNEKTHAIARVVGRHAVRGGCSVGAHVWGVA